MPDVSDIRISFHAYCTMADIFALNPQRTYNASTKPTRVQVIKMAQDWFQKVNGALDVLGYAIPVASSNGTSIRILSRLNALPVAAQAEESTYSVFNSDQSGHAVILREQFKEEWNDFTKGKISLPNATRTSPYFPKMNERQPKYAFHQVKEGTEEKSLFKKNMDF